MDSNLKHVIAKSAQPLFRADNFGMVGDQLVNGLFLGVRDLNGQILGA